MSVAAIERERRRVRTATLRPDGRGGCGQRAQRHKARAVAFVKRSTMRMTDVERDKLLLTVAADLAQRRRARGLKLNFPESVAILSCYVLEGARDGKTVAELMDGGRSVLSRADVMDGIAEMLDEVQMEATFPDGTKLVTIHEPIR